MSLTILSAATERKNVLMEREVLQRTSGSGKDVPYTPGEKWRNNKMYLTDDEVTDSNGKEHVCAEPNRNKPPTNNPLFWKPKTAEVITPWANDPIGTQYYDGTDGANPQSKRKNNSKDWKCVKSHTKTAGNSPKAGSEFWEVLA